MSTYSHTFIFIVLNFLSNLFRNGGAASMQISNLLSNMENRWFVGREKELNAIAEVSITDPSWRLLHLYGPTGIGKTTLLKRFQTIQSDSTIIFLSGLEGYDTKEKFLADLFEEVQKLKPDAAINFSLNEQYLANKLNELAKEAEKIVLLLDSFELWSPIHKWFREKWIPLLSIQIRIVTSSRFQLPADWLRTPGWFGLIKTIEIGSLKKQTVQQYLDLRGIHDNDSRYYIEYYSKGVPLALRIICDIVELNGGTFREENEDFRHFLYSLSQQLLSASNEIINHQEILTIASLFWWFDYDLLNSVCDESITTSQFHQFCQLPYIELSENDCWRVNDAIRQWLNTDLSVRNPEKYEFLLKKATLALTKKLETMPAERKLPYVFNTLHVNQNGYIKRFGFGASNRQFTPCPINESEIPILMDMFRNFVVSLKPFLPDKWHQDKYFHEVWTSAPYSFIGFRFEERLVGFLTFVPLNKDTRKLFLKNPVYQEYIRKSKHQEKEYLIWVISSDPQYDPDVTAFILRYIFSNLAEDTLINVVSPFPDLSNIFKSLGFKTIDWYQKKYTNETPMTFLQLDLRNRDLSMAITQSLKAPKQIQINGIIEMTALLKKFFVTFHKSESEEIIQAVFSSFPYLTNETDSGGFRKYLIKVIERMDQGSEEEQLYATIIKLAYIKKTANHELIADRLNLSLSTYYRYLKRSIEKVAYLLLENQHD